jgi:hypothetical protein
MPPQPYRRGKPRQPGAALDAMRRGRTAFGHNPADARRAMHKAARRKKRRSSLYSRVKELLR